MGWQAASHEQSVLQPETCWCDGIAAFGIAMGHRCRRAQQRGKVTGISSTSSRVSVPAPGKSLSTNNGVFAE